MASSCGRSCGKSTLLKLMNGIIPEFYDGDIGSVMVNGMNTFTTQFINYLRM